MMVDTISASAREGRLLVWSPDAEVEQALGAVEGITGALGSDPLEPVVGLYLNDNTWAKMCPGTCLWTRRWWAGRRTPTAR